MSHELLSPAAARIAAIEPDLGYGNLSSPLETALVSGRALGRFCQQTEDGMFGGPDAIALDAVAGLGALGLAVSIVSRSLGGRELARTRALMLAGAQADAEPGDDDWTSWLGALAAAASTMVARACAVHAGDGEDEQLEDAGRMLLVASLRTLARFGD